MARPRRTGEKTGTGKRRIEQYDHKGQQRKNNPPVGLVTEATDRDTGKKQYAYDPHLDPTLTWAGKAEHTSFELPTVSLHVHERIDPKTIMEAVRRRNGTPAPVRGSLFESPEKNPPLRRHRTRRPRFSLDELLRERCPRVGCAWRIPVQRAACAPQGATGHDWTKNHRPPRIRPFWTLSGGSEIRV